MSLPSRSRPLAPDRLSAHPAVQIWAQLRPGQAMPTAVEKLRLRSKSAVYRLRGAGPKNESVIAKRCRRETGRVERLIYEQILPSLPLPALRFFGLADDRDDQLAWLFIEDAGEEPFLFSSPEHCAAVARWLAILHTSASRLTLVEQLPDRSPDHYRYHLRLARHNLMENLANPALTPDGQAAFEQILAQCERLESRWDLIEKLCAGTPWTFTHGDLKENNMRIRRTPRGIVLLPFDWEIAGWGVPATDLLKCPDLARYESEARTVWPRLSLADLQRLANLGQVFRALIAIYWESLDLGREWVQWPVEKLRFYSSRLAEGTRSLRIT